MILKLINWKNPQEIDNIEKQLIKAILTSNQIVISIPRKLYKEMEIKRIIYSKSSCHLSVRWEENANFCSSKIISAIKDNMKFLIIYQLIWRTSFIIWKELQTRIINLKIFIDFKWNSYKTTLSTKWSSTIKFNLTQIYDERTT